MKPHYLSRREKVGIILGAVLLGSLVIGCATPVSPEAAAAAKACAARDRDPLWVESGRVLGIFTPPTEHPAAWERRQAECLAERGFGPPPPTYAQDAARCAAAYEPQGPRFESCMVGAGWSLEEARTGRPR